MDPKTLRARKPPERPGAIAGVAADFERYARAAADEDGDGGGMLRPEAAGKAKAGGDAGEEDRVLELELRIGDG